uniref:Uncharacterized protein n=1 Tax=Clytia hemisphaerica TaxID=252671 RepID=A0A7M6DMM2_9CNID
MVQLGHVNTPVSNSTGPWKDGRCMIGKDGRPEFYTKQGHQPCVLNDGSHNCPLTEMKTMNTEYPHCFICCWSKIAETKCPTLPQTTTPPALNVTKQETRGEEQTSPEQTAPGCKKDVLFTAGVSFLILFLCSLAQFKYHQNQRLSLVKENDNLKETLTNIIPENPVQDHFLGENEPIRNDVAAGDYDVNQGLTDEHVDVPSGTKKSFHFDTNDVEEGENQNDEGIGSSEASSRESIC